MQKTIDYKHASNSTLKLHIFDEGGPGDPPRPAIVFFFGGGWVNGTPTQFFPHCQYLASRGMVAISAEYRVHSRHATTPFECVVDGKSAIRWVRAHTNELGIDPQRVAAGGGSAGGHVAACATMVPSFGESGEDASISAIPDALVLFNPVVDTTPERFAPRLDGRAAALSPLHHVKPGLPPTIIFHGIDDFVVPYSDVERFTNAMHAANNVCELVGFKGKGHGFFNHGRDDGTAYYETLRAANCFLAEQGFLTGEPTLEEAFL
jgi:acetyl esterase